MTTSSDSDTGEQMCAYVLLEEHSDYLSLDTTNRFSTKTHLVMSFYKSDTKTEHAEKSERKRRKKSTFNVWGEKFE